MRKIAFGLIALLLAATAYFYPLLPQRLPMHWNIHGQIDNYGDKSFAVWLMPAITILMFIGFKLIPLLDPKKDKYHLFKREWETIQLGFIAFFSYMQFIIFYSALNKGVNILPLMFIGLGSLFIMLGNYLSKIRQNYFIGIKTPWALADEDNWNKTHRFASWCFVILGIMILIESYFLWFASVIVFGSVMMTAILPAIYSFLLYKKKQGMMKFIIIALFILFFGIFVIRLTSGEDDWICRDGRWIKHGIPSAPMPKTVCK